MEEEISRADGVSVRLCLEAGMLKRDIQKDMKRSWIGWHVGFGGPHGNSVGLLG